MSMGPVYRKDTPAEKAAQREKRIAASIKARAIPWTKDNWREHMAAETAATGDKLSLQQLPGIGKYIPEMLDVTGGIGSMASALGSAPLRANQQNSLLPYAAAVGIPLVAGALGGVGANSTGQFANNMVNPLAGTGSIAKAIRDKLTSKFTKGNKNKVFIEQYLTSNKKGKILLPLDKEKLKQEVFSDNKATTLYDEADWAEAEPIIDSRIKYDDLPNLIAEQGESFRRKYGTRYTEEDLSLFAKMEAINKDRLQNQTFFSLDSDKSLSDSFIDKHQIAKEYTPIDELLTDAYTKGYDSRINNRVGHHKADANISFYKKEVAPKLEELIKKNKLKSPEVLYRGEADYLIKKVWRNGVKQPKGTIRYSELQKGDIFKPGSFVSTSISESKAKNFGAISSEIAAPAGQSVLFPNATGVRNFFPEKEVLLPKKLKFRVEEVTDTPVQGRLTEGPDILKRYYRHSITNPYLMAGAIAGATQLKQE